MERMTSRSSISLQEGGFRKLRLFINKATNLLKGDTFGLSDPYVQATVVGASEVVHSNTKKTSVVKKTLNPYWREELEFWIKGDMFSVILDVFDENRLIRDDFLGRQILHFDFTSPERRPPVVHTQAPRQAVEVIGKSCTLSLKDKYTNLLLDGYDHMIHVPALRNQFFLKRLTKARTSINNRGRLSVSYVFVDSSEDFEHVEIPTGETTGQATPTATPDEDGASEEREEVELPPGWEERVGANGRRIYINHLTRAVSVRRPGLQGTAGSSDTSTPPTSHRRHFLDRHTSIEVIEEQGSVGEDEEEEHPPAPAPDEGSNLHLLDSVSLATHPHPPSPSPSPSHSPSPSPSHFPTPLVPSAPLPSAPPLDLTRPTGVPQATPTGVPHTTPTAFSQATRTAAFQATPIATPQPLRPQLNLGAAAARIPLGASPHQSLALQRAAQGLPSTWQAAMTPDGRIYFINHINRTTTWEKPRLQERHVQPAPRPPQSPVEQDSSLPEGWEVRRTGDGRVYYVDHNSRSTSWDHPNSRKHSEDLGPLPSGWEMKQMSDGRLFYVDHNTHSTQWEDPRLTAKNKPTAKMQYSRDYKQKYTNFRSKLPKVKPNAPNFLDLPVRRDNLFEDSFTAVTNVRNMDHFHSRLYVKFAGEHGLDYGGVAREWFHFLSHEMFSPYYGLFEYAASDDYTLQISPESGIYNEHHLDYFKFVGRMIGLAIYHQHILDAFFIRPFYKMILGKPVALPDMESVDEELYNSIQYILENDPEPLCLTFSANKTVFGQVMEEELKPGGGDIAVTETNKREYINLLIKWRFTDRVQKQMDAIKNYLLGGLSSIDVEDWKKNTDLVGYSPYDNIIVWFWKAVENYDNEMRARLLQFVTGTSKVPMNGFAELQGSNGPRKFCIKRIGSPNSLPRAHTCFNRIDLPPYASYHQLKEKLKLAVENTEGFEGVD